MNLFNFISPKNVLKFLIGELLQEKGKGRKMVLRASLAPWSCVAGEGFEGQGGGPGARTGVVS